MISLILLMLIARGLFHHAKMLVQSRALQRK